MLFHMILWNNLDQELFHISIKNLNENREFSDSKFHAWQSTNCTTTDMGMTAQAVDDAEKTK